MLDPDCRATRRVLLDAVEGWLPEAARLDAAEHVGRCAACADELADLVAASHAVRRALTGYRGRARVAPARARLRAASPQPGFGAWALGGLARVAWVPAQQALAVAAALALFVGSVGLGAPQDAVAGPDRVSLAIARHPAIDVDELRPARGLLRPSERIPLSDDFIIEVLLAQEGADAARDSDTTEGQ